MMVEWMESRREEGVGGTKAHLFICSRRGLRLPGLGVAMEAHRSRAGPCACLGESKSRSEGRKAGPVCLAGTPRPPQQWMRAHGRGP